MQNPIQQRIHIQALKKVAQQFLGMERFNPMGLLMVVLFFLGAGWLPDAVTNLLLPGGNTLAGVFQLTGSAAVFFTFGWIVARKVKEVQQVRVISAIPPSARNLIIFLSTPNPDHMAAIKSSVESGNVSPGIFTKTSWEMPYLAIKHHAERLEELYVFTSSGARGSHQLFDCFKTACKHLFPGIIVQELDEHGIDFEDIEIVHNKLDALYAAFDERNIYGPQDVMIDITGGQKPNSIAGAMATLSEGRRFQYVSKKDDSNQVLSYDLVIEKS